jgi:hypothetical protein
LGLLPVPAGVKGQQYGIVEGLDMKIGSLVLNKVPDVDIEACYIGPTEAKTLLANQIDNQRKSSERRINEYIKEMLGDKWRLSNDAIVIVNGKTANGKHRLCAVVESGVTCEFLVWKTSDENIIRIMDGGKMRTVPNVLQMEGCDYAVDLSSTTMWVLGYKRQLLTATSNQIGNSVLSPAKTLTRQERIEFILRNQVNLREAVSFCKCLYEKYAIIPSSMPAAVQFLIAEHADRNTAKEFIQGIYDGETTSAAIKQLRTALIKERTSHRKLPRASLFGMMIKTYNSYRKGTCPGMLAMKSTDAFPKLEN